MFTPSLTNALHDFSIPKGSPPDIGKKTVVQQSIDSKTWKQLKKLETELITISTSFESAISTPDEATLKIIVNSKRRIENIQPRIDALKSNIPLLSRTKEFIDFSHQLDSTLQRVSSAEHLLEFDREYAALYDELGEILIKMTDQEWLLSRGESSFAAANYIELLSVLEKFYRLHDKHQVFPASCQNAHEYLDRNLKQIFGLVDSALKGHSMSVRGLLPRVLAERQQELLLAQQNLLEIPSLTNYTKLVEATKRLEMLRDQFQESSQNLEKTHHWLSSYQTSIQPKPKYGLALSIWNRIMDQFLNPSTKEGRLGLIADQFHQDQLFYADASRQLTAAVNRSEKIVQTGTKKFLKSLSDTPLKSGGQGKILIETVRTLRNSTAKKAPTITEFVAIRRQISSISFLFEQCQIFQKQGGKLDKVILSRVEQAHKEGEKLLQQLEKQNPDLHYGDLYEEIERYALLEAQWEEELAASELSEDTKRKINLFFLAIQLFVPAFKAIENTIDILPEWPKASFFAEAASVPYYPSSLEGWTMDFLEGRNITAADFSQHKPSEVLNTLKQLEYENLRMHHVVSQEYTENSYLLREECLLRSGGEITSCEAFTYSSDPKLCQSTDRVISEREWHPHRLHFQRKILAVKFKEAIAMSKRLDDSVPSVYAMRGNTASGKTRTIKRDPFFKKAMDVEGEIKGAINPDLIKSELIESTSGATHAQVHREGAAVSSRMSEKIAREVPSASVIIDKRLDERGDIDDVISSALGRNATVNFFDVDAPLEDSCLGVLTRSAHGTDPLVPFDAVTKGYLGIRQNRTYLIEKVQSDPSVGSYKLYSKGVLIAEKTIGGKFSVIAGQEAEFNRITSEVTHLHSDIANVRDKVLTADYIKNLLQERPYLTGIEKFEGMTIKTALNMHASGKL